MADPSWLSSPPVQLPLSSPERACRVCICAHKPVHKTPMCTQQTPHKVTTMNNDPRCCWKPQMLLRTFQQCCYNRKEIFYKSLYPRVIMSHPIVLGCQPWSPACPKPLWHHTNTTSHTQQMRPVFVLTSTESQPMFELQFLQQLLCRDPSAQTGVTAESEPKLCTLSINLPYISNMLMAVTCK